MSAKSKPASGHGQAPADAPQVRWWAIILSLVLLAIAFVAGRELIIAWNMGNVAWTPWLTQLPAFLTTRSPEWTAVAGVITAAVGVILVVASLLPRKKRYLPLSVATSSVWVRQVDLARYSTAAAKRIPGVLAASSLARKGRVTVTAAVMSPEDTANRDRILEALRADVQPAFGEHIDVHLLLREAGPDDGATTPRPGAVNVPEMTTVHHGHEHDSQATSRSSVIFHEVTEPAPVESQTTDVVDDPAEHPSASMSHTISMRRVDDRNSTARNDQGENS